MHDSIIVHSESKQVLGLGVAPLRQPWQPGSPANESSTQRKTSESGLQPSIDLTFYSELYLNLASLLGVCPIFKKTKEKVICVRRRQGSGKHHQ